MSHTDLLVTVVGESLVDIIRDPHAATPQAHPSGSPLNVAVGVSRLGMRTNLVTHYADDTHGTSLEKHLSSNGVGVNKGGSAATS